MKKSDLHREWARVLYMCEGTKASPLMCWKGKGGPKPISCGYAPEFTKDPDTYEFAVAILADKPVFVGDKVWSTTKGLLTVKGAASDYKDCIAVMESENVFSVSHLSWNPPKKTFLLNGEELPRPVKLDDQVKHSFSLGIFCHHAFDTQDDCNKVLNAINKLLRDNTK